MQGKTKQNKTKTNFIRKQQFWENQSVPLCQWNYFYNPHSKIWNTTRQGLFILPFHWFRPMKFQEDQQALKWEGPVDLLVFRIFIKLGLENLWVSLNRITNLAGSCILWVRKCKIEPCYRAFSIIGPSPPYPLLRQNVATLTDGNGEGKIFSIFCPCTLSLNICHTLYCYVDPYFWLSISVALWDWKLTNLQQSLYFFNPIMHQKRIISGKIWINNIVYEWSQLR